MADPGESCIILLEDGTKVTAPCSVAEAHRAISAPVAPHERNVMGSLVKIPAGDVDAAVIVDKSKIVVIR